MYSFRNKKVQKFHNRASESCNWSASSCAWNYTNDKSLKQNRLCLSYQATTLLAVAHSELRQISAKNVFSQARVWSHFIPLQSDNIGKVNFEDRETVLKRQQFM